MTPRSVADLAAKGFAVEEGLRFPLDKTEIATLVAAALDEDDAKHDITTAATVPPDRRAGCRIVARKEGVIAGLVLAREAFCQLDDGVQIRSEVNDGAAVSPGTPLMLLTGCARFLLSAERVALNFVQRLSGIASLTALYCEAVRGTNAKILDTRKTTPGWRKLERYAVRAGGGMNHRFNLGSAVLIKDNHLAAVDGDVTAAVKRARAISPEGIVVEVECETLAEAEAALSTGADVIMLDNMKPHELAEAVKLIGGRAVTEASGGINLKTVRAVAESGVDWISIGALTHSAPALDIALDFD